LYPELEALDTVAVAISQEDEDLESFSAMPKRFEGKFPVLADLGREKSKAFDRTTAYLIDKKGIVREVFPMIIHARPSWRVVLNELERIDG
jgi:peroxiredoxin